MIYKSAMSYNENKGSKFSTWLANQMRYFCLNSMNKNRLVATEEEVMNLSDLISKFDFKSVQKKSAIFDPKKLSFVERFKKNWTH